MLNDRDLQAPWAGKSDWDYFGWETEDEAKKRELAYDEYIDRLIDEERDNEALRQMEGEENDE